jgi:hypothetical protein
MRPLLLVFLLACSRREEPQKITSAVPASIPSATTPAPEVFTASVADFRDDVLSGCVDFSHTDKAKVSSFANGDAGTALSKTCAEQFKDRKPLASCDVVRKKDGARVVASYYDFGAVGLDDIEMQECIKAGGDWKAVSKTSSEWLRAKHEHNGRNLHKAREDLRKAVKRAESAHAQEE